MSMVREGFNPSRVAAEAEAARVTGTRSLGIIFTEFEKAQIQVEAISSIFGKKVGLSLGGIESGHEAGSFSRSERVPSYIAQLRLAEAEMKIGKKG